jgi:glutamate racemase
VQKENHTEKRIGIFDSGVGGLTILKPMVSLMPNEKFYYFGDTKNVPYGTKSPKEIAKIGVEAYKKLRKLGIKMLVIGCNTTSIYGIKAIKEIADVPIIELIHPGVLAVKECGCKNILLLATEATINSGSIQSLLKKEIDDVKVEGIATQDMVITVENGNSNNEEGKKVVHRYLDMVTIRPDSVLLSCTHFPALSKFIADYFNNKGIDVNIISPAEKCAEIAKEKLKEIGKLTEFGNLSIEYFCSGDLEKFTKSGNILLDDDLIIKNVKKL